MENFPLKSEVIHGTTPQQPDYIQNAKTVDTSPIYQNDPSRKRFRHSFISPNDIFDGEMDFGRFLEVFNVHSRTSLEASQCEALKQALVNRLAIIQGENTFPRVLNLHICCTLSSTKCRPGINMKSIFGKKTIMFSFRS
jgi:hypothetical protein